MSASLYQLEIKFDWDISQKWKIALWPLWKPLRWQNGSVFRRPTHTQTNVCNDVSLFNLLHMSLFFCKLNVCSFSLICVFWAYKYMDVVSLWYYYRNHTYGVTIICALIFFRYLCYRKTWVCNDLFQILIICFMHISTSLV